MSGSETGLMASRELFSVGLQMSPVPSQPVIQNMRLAFSSDGTAVYKPINATSPSYQPNSTGSTPVAAGGGGGGGVEAVSTGGHGMTPSLNMNMGSEPIKRKRGRPRKYGPDSAMGLALIPAQQSVGGGFSSPPLTASASLPSGGSVSPTSYKKARGRPPGSTKKQQLEALGSAGVAFTPHVITVKAGEDVSSKVLSFSQHGPRAVCILTANGAISNVTLRQPATSGGTVTYEGRFEILSLTGSFLLTENGDQRSRTGGLSVMLSGPDGRVLGGCVAGLLTAASPVQVVVGSFLADGNKEVKQSANQMDPVSAPPKLVSVGGTAGPSSPPSRGTLCESSGGAGSPLNPSTGGCNNNNPQSMLSMPWK